MHWARYSGAPFPRIGTLVDGLHVGEHVANLSSLDASLVDYEVLPGVREVPLSEFDSAPRDLFYAADDIERTKRLAEKIQESGRIDPLIVVVDDEGPYILEGAHRLGALHLLGKRSLPAVVVLDTEDG